MPQNYGNQIQTFNSFSTKLCKYHLGVSIVCTYVIILVNASSVDSFC